MLNYAVKYGLCALLLICAGCGSYHQSYVQQGTPEQTALQSRQCRAVSYVDAYPENWEHALNQRALAAK